MDPLAFSVTAPRLVPVAVVSDALAGEVALVSLGLSLRHAVAAVAVTRSAIPIFMKLMARKGRRVLRQVRGAIVTAR